MDEQRYYKKIVESLKLLSLPFNEQKKYFPVFVDVPFEILDTFDKAFLLLPKVIEARKVKYDAIANLLRLHHLINSVVNNSDFQHMMEEQINEYKEWIKIRELAKEILQIMKEMLDFPNIEYI